MVDVDSVRECGLRSGSSHPHGKTFQEYCDQRKEESENRVFDALREANGVIETKHLQNFTAYQRLRSSGKLFIIHLDRGTYPGSFKRNIQIFKPEYHHKVFACTTRTNVVRLLQKALSPIKDQITQTLISHYLASIVSEAERLAILWHLKSDFAERPNQIIRKLIQKQSIQLDGFYRGKNVPKEVPV